MFIQIEGTYPNEINVIVLENVIRDCKTDYVPKYVLSS